MTMQLFSKQKQRARRERLLSQVELSISRKQKLIADELNRRTQHWNRASKLILLLVICTVLGGFSLWLLIQACN
ncbi:hypothetical protein [Mucilaginibacter paludis]|uniref:Uncharacterized protein n=1 Tax=Mucilaginibacter paludis DSM 18603 TaxID=714943 RepID=H1YIB5_9SPHI|nr:hypothetical protein [Mucilaginibacter paludis]EHQ27528.1 hypothetical protein Mucpa_3429 [Mucilaginibacter paludis DSM 18603]